MIEDRDWQKIGYGTNRLKVPGGWFVMLYTGGPSKTAFFYPDPEHTWDGGALKEEVVVEDALPPPPPPAVPVIETAPAVEAETAGSAI